MSTSYQKRIFLFLVLSCVCLAGCASVAPPVLDKADESRSLFFTSPFHGEHKIIDTDTSGAVKYRLYATGTTGFTLSEVVKDDVETAASTLCNKENKKVKVLEERRSVGHHGLGNYPRYEIVFVCI